MPGTGTTAVAGGGSYYFGLEDYETNSPATAPVPLSLVPQLTFYDSPNGLINGAFPVRPNAQYGHAEFVPSKSANRLQRGEWPIPV